ncbi:glycosyltransferase family 4 protein [uncultured Methanomethylovorans sp.]|uniref:glycosyltransferase family 4 protein n=1 Tax=uncultured Methanomethylovorans sp. TaxID=183759 RepID=UPI002AA94161|nr:glycosyltransferase family 4 protein [uncultured Methanomethylovorans sp.]
MKILQIYELSPHDNVGTGGIEVAIMETSREFVALGHEVTILTGARDIPQEQIIDGVQIISIDFCSLMKYTWNGANLSLARQALFPLVVLFNRPDTYDIYHGHIYSSGLIANYLARRAGGVAVNTIHGSYYPIWSKLANPFAARFYRTGERILAPALAKLSDIQFHTGDYFAQQVLAWGASKQKVKTIHNGADIVRFSPSLSQIADSHLITSSHGAIDSSIPVILTARRLVKKNGIEYLIKAMQLVLKEKQCQLMIIGEGAEHAALEQLTHDLDLQDNVHFLGLIPHEQLPPYLALADIAVIPSLMEASSIFMLEAMAMEKPVIATNAGGLPEVLPQSTGILVEPMDEMGLADAILELLQCEEKRLQLGKKAREHVEVNYSWKAVAKQMEAEYMRLLARKKKTLENQGRNYPSLISKFAANIVFNLKWE